METSTKSFIIGIDATNISSGGGVTHLTELLNSVDPYLHGFSKIYVWSCSKTLFKIKDKPWINKIHSKLLDMRLPLRVFYQQMLLPAKAKKLNCSILFVPGGTFLGNFHPFVTMSRNLLPFEFKEMKRYGFSFNFLKFLTLNITQSKTFKVADGVIFLSKYAENVVNKKIKKASSSVIIPHGIDNRFYSEPREQNQLETYSFNNPFRILYVSIIDLYKHQWNVVKAVAQLRENDLPIVLDLVGSANSAALKKFKKSLKNIKNSDKYINYLGAIPYSDLPKIYKTADLFLFASSCENLPNILLEGMASGLPIVCSNCGPMPEVLGDAGIYFDPENPDQIASSIKKLFLNPELRYTFANEAYLKAKKYSWKVCADETFDFILKTFDQFNNKNCKIP